MPKNNPPRERRLRAGEYEVLKDAARGSRSWYLWPIVDIAIETAMRRGEILNLEWQHIDWKKQRAPPPDNQKRQIKVGATQRAVTQAHQTDTTDRGPRLSNYGCCVPAGLGPACASGLASQI